MRKSTLVLLILILPLALTGCAGIGVDTMNRIQVGMTKSEVIALLGKPDNLAAVSSTQGKGEYFKYMLAEKGDEAWYWWGRKAYFVSFTNGKVDSFGKLSNFDSAKNSSPAAKTESQGPAPENATAAYPDKTDIPEKLRELKKLENDGVITHTDFEKQKGKLLDRYIQSPPAELRN